MKNMIFREDDYISLNVGTGKKSGDPFRLGTLVGVLTTGSGSTDGKYDLVVNSPTYNGDYRPGVGNKPGFASVALAGGAEVNIPAGLQPAVVGETLFINTSGVLTRTNTDQRFGKVTHLGRTNATAIVKIVQ